MIDDDLPARAYDLHRLRARLSRVLDRLDDMYVSKIDGALPDAELRRALSRASNEVATVIQLVEERLKP